MRFRGMALLFSGVRSSSSMATLSSSRIRIRDSGLFGGIRAFDMCPRSFRWLPTGTSRAVVMVRTARLRSNGKTALFIGFGIRLFLSVGPEGD